MACYVLADIAVTDPDAFAAYAKRVPETIARYGGRYLVRGGASEALEGDWRPGRVVLLEFASAEQARQWYNSPEYQEVLPIRQRHARSSIVIVEGVSPS